MNYWKKAFLNGSDKLEDYAKKRQLLPNLEVFLSYIDDWIKDNHPERQAIEKDYLMNLLIWMNDGYYYLGNPRRQKELLERALPILEKYYGPDHFQVARTLGNLGNAHYASGDPQKTKELLELRALPILEKHYGPDHPEVAKLLADLSDVYDALGEHKKQEELRARALSIFSES